MTTTAQDRPESLYFKIPRLIIAIALPLAILAGAFFGLKKLQAMLKPPPRKPREVDTLKVRCVELKPKTVQLHVDGFGSVRAKSEVHLAPQVTGRIDFVAPNLKAGAYVRKDQVLIQIDQSDFKHAADQARAQIAQAEAELKRIDQDEYNLRASMVVQEEKVAIAKRELDRIEEALKSEAVATTAREATALAYLNNQAALVAQKNQMALIPVRREGAQAALQAAKVRLADAELDRERTTIRSPIDALVIEEHLEPGQTLTAYQPVATLASSDAYEVPVIIDAEQLQRLAALPPESVWRDNQDPPKAAPAKATVTWLAFRDAFTWKGVLTRLEPFDQKTRTAPLVVEVPNPLKADGQAERPPLALQAYCRVRIEGKELSDALVVPEQAIQEGERLYLMNDDKALHIEPVRVRMRMGESAIIEPVQVEENGRPRPSVKFGDQVITTPILYPVEGMALERIPSGTETQP